LADDLVRAEDVARDRGVAHDARLVDVPVIAAGIQKN
jgi:hypothetical protein